jgi:hypothetical protein
MGVNRTDFVLIGANIGFDKYDDNIWEEENNDYDKYNYRRKEAGDMVYIIDGMGGDYFIIGQIIKIDEGDYDGLGFIDAVQLDSELYETKVKVKNFIKDRFMVDSEEFENKIEPKLLIFSHFS